MGTLFFDLAPKGIKAPSNEPLLGNKWATGNLKEAKPAITLPFQPPPLRSKGAFKALPPKENS